MNLVTWHVQMVVRKHPAPGAPTERRDFSFISRHMLDKMLPLFTLSLTLSLLLDSCFLISQGLAGFALSSSVWDILAVFLSFLLFLLAFIYKEQSKSVCKKMVIVNLLQLTLWCTGINAHLCLGDKWDSSARKWTFLSSFTHPHECENTILVSE